MGHEFLNKEELESKKIGKMVEGKWARGEFPVWKAENNKLLRIQQSTETG